MIYLIDYLILEDGTCSHCGNYADLILLPDGDCALSGSCEYCDEYNTEQLLEHKAILGTSEPMDFFQHELL